MKLIFLALASDEYPASLERRLREAGAVFTICSDSDLLERSVEALDEGKAVGWFQGPMEFGPRALGNRSNLGRFPLTFHAIAAQFEGQAPGIGPAVRAFGLGIGPIDRQMVRPGHVHHDQSNVSFPDAESPVASLERTCGVRWRNITPAYASTARGKMRPLAAAAWPVFPIGNITRQRHGHDGGARSKDAAMHRL